MVVLHSEGVAVAVGAAEVLLLVMQVFEGRADRLIGVNVLLKNAVVALEELSFVHLLPAVLSL